ncbi:ACOT2 thioesterase, partial [Amia calva]|nr:ACOT2 thioesterase [Amia calva]
MSSEAQIQILPRSRCLFDEPVQVTAQGLRPGQAAEVRAKLTDEKGELFQSSATYTADGNGDIDLRCSPALGGSFRGIEPMGLFWSLKANTPHTKLAKKDVSRACLVEIELHSTGGDILATATNERVFIGEGVRRIPVTDGTINGTLFIPPGRITGPFPGVLDLYVFGGGLSEIRPCLLANRGFVVLTVALYGCQDMPMSTINLEYLEHALNFLRSHPQVKGPGLGLLAISKSGDLALSMSSFLPGISATVCINSCNANVMLPLHYKGRVIPPLMFDPHRAVLTETGALDVKATLHDPRAPENRATVIPIEQADCTFLFAASEDDKNWDSCLYAEEAARRLREHGKENFKVLVYPGAGHYLDCPYMPHCSSSYHAVNRNMVLWGGEPKGHAEAQVDLWKRIQAFFREHLDEESRYHDQARL